MAICFVCESSVNPLSYLRHGRSLQRTIDVPGTAANKGFHLEMLRMPADRHLSAAVGLRVSPHATMENVYRRFRLRDARFIAASYARAYGETHFRGAHEIHERLARNHVATTHLP